MNNTQKRSVTFIGIGIVFGIALGLTALAEYILQNFQRINLSVIHINQWTMGGEIIVAFFALGIGNYLIPMAEKMIQNNEYIPDNVLGYLMICIFAWFTGTAIGIVLTL